ncbi:MAG: O-antigen ligase family protein, partial [Desulfobaccales bacterium]
LGMSFYQNILGGVIRTEETIGGLMRNIGFYHDAYTLRYYTLQTLAGLILYGAYFIKRGQVWLRRGLMALGLFCLFTIYRIFSKAGYLILAQWGTVWLVFKKQIVLLMMILVLGGLTVAFARFTWVEDIQEVYSKELGALKGQERVERALQGRVGGWLAAWDNWKRKPFSQQLFGSGTTALGAHNDFLRVLLGTGIIGLLLYLVILAWALAKATVNVFRAATPLNIMALMLLLMWLIDAMGLVPGGYPGYQIFVWGFVGLAFRGVVGLDDPETNEYSIK